MHPIDRTHGRGLAAHALPLDSGVYPPKREPEVPGNQLDDCGVCVLLPTVSGKGVRATQVGCPVHGEPRRHPAAAADLPVGSVVVDTVHVWIKQAWQAPGGGHTWSRSGSAESWRDEAVDDAFARRGAMVLRAGSPERSDLPEGQQSKSFGPAFNESAEEINAAIRKLVAGLDTLGIRPYADNPSSWSWVLFCLDGIDKLQREFARVRAAVAEEIAQDLASRAAPETNHRYRETRYLLPEQAAAIAREHAATPAERSVGSPTPEVGTPTGGWEIQGFIENYDDAGRAGWSTVRRSPAEVAAFLSEALIDDAPREVILIRRGPQVEAADGGIGPWRLVSADRPACTCCGRRVAPLAQGVCGHCLNRCGAGGCSLRPAGPSLPETQEGGQP